MKKTLSILLSGIVMMAGLTSCDNSNSTLPVRDDWTESEANSIKEALRDVALPFFKLSNEYTFESSTRKGMVVIEMEDANVSDLKNIEKAFRADADWEIANEIGSKAEQPYFGNAVYAVDTVKISGVEYAVVSQYGIYTNEDDYGAVDKGTLQFAAYLSAQLTDKSEQYETYELAKAGVIKYFADYGYEGLAMPESIETSASSYEMTDLRFVYYYYYSQDIAIPYAVLDFYDAKESELSAVTSAFEGAGYAKKTQEKTDKTEAYDYYWKDGIKVVVSFELADASYGVPDRIEINIYPSEK